jgi:hypothetical protein
MRTRGRKICANTSYVPIPTPLQHPGKGTLTRPIMSTYLFVFIDIVLHCKTTIGYILRPSSPLPGASGHHFSPPNACDRGCFAGAPALSHSLTTLSIHFRLRAALQMIHPTGRNMHTRRDRSLCEGAGVQGKIAWRISIVPAGPRPRDGFRFCP